MTNTETTTILPPELAALLARIDTSFSAPTTIAQRANNLRDWSGRYRDRNPEWSEHLRAQCIELRTALANRGRCVHEGVPLAICMCGVPNGSPGFHPRSS